MKEEKTVVITAKVHEALIARLQEKGYTVQYLPEISYEELAKIIAYTEGIIVTTRINLDRSILDKAVALKWIGRLGSGMELIDTEYAVAKGIICASSPEGNRNSVAEHTLGMMLSMLHKINSSSNEVRALQWHREENRGTELAGKTIGIIGFGNTGSSLAKLLSVFEVTVLAYDKNKYGFANDYVKEANLDQICRYADLISFHVPLTPETRHMANFHFFESLERRPYILNTSRGSVLHLAALIDALEKDRIAGAALDVLENEQFNSFSVAEKEEIKYLTSQSNVLITPHIAGYSHEAFYKMGMVILEKLGI